jgi:hypothetical protein
MGGCPKDRETELLDNASLSENVNTRIISLVLLDVHHWRCYHLGTALQKLDNRIMK